MSGTVDIGGLSKHWWFPSKNGFITIIIIKTSMVKIVIYWTDCCVEEIETGVIFNLKYKLESLTKW